MKIFNEVIVKIKRKKFTVSVLYGDKTLTTHTFQEEYSKVDGSKYPVSLRLPKKISHVRRMALPPPNIWFKALPIFQENV